MKIIQVKGNSLIFKGKTYKCTIGKNGYTNNKVEGDNKTPIGKFKLLYGYYRDDRVGEINSDLKLTKTMPHYGWCDDKSHDYYNKFVELPFKESFENLYRGDNVYDIVIVLDYNIQPAIKGKGSAIFFHIANKNFTGTEGCVAIEIESMIELLNYIDENTYMEILGE